MGSYGFLGRYEETRIFPVIMDSTDMIRFLVKEGRGMDALYVLNRMKEDGIKPSIVCYIIVLSVIVV